MKTAVLLLYRRLFPTPKFKRACDVGLVFNTANFFAMALVVAFQCRHIPDAWKQPNSRPCVNQVAFFNAAAAISIDTDCAILLLPLCVVWRLHMARRQKFWLTGLFLLGGLFVFLLGLRLPPSHLHPSASRPYFLHYPSLACSYTCHEKKGGY